MRVLVIGKDETDLELWARFLQMTGHEYITTSDAELACEQIKGHVPLDAIITGFYLNGHLTGLGLLRLASEQSHREAVTRVLVTGHVEINGDWVMRQCRHIGAKYWPRGFMIDEKIKELEAMKGA